MATLSFTIITLSPNNFPLSAYSHKHPSLQFLFITIYKTPHFHSFLLSLQKSTQYLRNFNILTHPVYFSLWSLYQCLQNNIQVLLKCWTNTQSNIAKYREDLRFHWPMNCVILENKDSKLLCYLSWTVWNFICFHIWITIILTEREWQLLLQNYIGHNLKLF